MHFRSLSPETRVTFAYYPHVGTSLSVSRSSQDALAAAAPVRAEFLRGSVEKEPLRRSPGAVNSTPKPFLVFE
eukprot:6429252-Prymnesium_polylepis.1